MKVVKLGEICEMYQPKTISTKEMVPDGKYTVFGANGAIGKYDKYNHESPQLLVTCRGATCGSVNISEPFSWINGNAMVIKPKVNRVTFDYLKYAFLGGINVSGAITGSAQPQITRTTLEQILIPIPSINCQNLAVEKLDKAFAEIDSLTHKVSVSIKNLSSTFDSFLDNLLQDQISKNGQMKLVDALDIARGGSPRPINSFLTNDKNGINWIKISDATSSKKYITETAQRIRPEGVIRSRVVKPGDFLLSNSMSFGRPYIMATTGCIHDGWLVLSNNKNLLNQDYLYYVLGSKYIYDQFNRTAAGSTVRNLNINLAGQVTFPVPSLETQAYIVSKLEDLETSIDALKNSLSNKLLQLDQLKNSFLSKAFSASDYSDKATQCH